LNTRIKEFNLEAAVFDWPLPDVVMARVMIQPPPQGNRPEPEIAKNAS
jgi:hypothetical protein